MVLFFVDKKTAKERKRTLSGILHDALYTCLSKWPPKNHEQITRLTKCTCKVCLVVDHPEIALTLEKCIIESKIIICFT